MAGLIPFNRRKNELLPTGMEDLENMLDDFFSDAWPLRRSLHSDTFKVDVEEKDKEYLVTAELPGVKKEEMHVTLEEGKLRIAIRRDEDVEDKGRNFIHKERRYCSMERSIFLKDADAEGIKAKLEEGLLKIRVPRSEKIDTGRRIEIE